MSTRTRAACAAFLSLACALLLAGPAAAADGTVTDPSVMDQSPQVMTPGEAVLVFLGIPLLVVALVWLIVSAPGWTRSGRVSDAEAWSGDPLVVEASDASATAVTGAQTSADDETGGTSARW